MHVKKAWWPRGYGVSLVIGRLQVRYRLGHFATPFRKEFNLTMAFIMGFILTVAAIAPPRCSGELSRTTLANQHNQYAAQRSLLIT